ncbi:MAG TPA: hypothetical protein VK716_03060 [Terracidiphilus sp.]|jgi:hypothetical protein|nr:hypothetical protein [Terracidiphilus sp.]
MEGSWTRVLGFCLVLGMTCTSFGAYECLKGHNYSVAAESETTVVGRITRVPRKGGFEYKFSVNGVNVDDSSDVCETPLDSDACFNNGPVLVYYASQPFPNSRLENFSVASTNSYQLGIPAIGMGLPFLLLPIAVKLIFQLRRRRENDNQQGAIRVVPGE